MSQVNAAVADPASVDTAMSSPSRFNTSGAITI